MILRIPQRGMMDCAICAVAMVMGPPYSYERVAADSARYEHVTREGKFHEWWVPYLQHEGFAVCFRPASDLSALGQFGGTVVGLFGMTIPHVRMRHVVAVDALGVVDPADNFPDYVALSEYAHGRVGQGVVFDDEFLAVKKAV
jgi:hypothetical protein